MAVEKVATHINEMQRITEQFAEVFHEIVEEASGFEVNLVFSFSFSFSLTTSKCMNHYHFSSLALNQTDSCIRVKKNAWDVS